MKILYLPLKKEWYEMIERGDKREEYRENTRYWKTRLIDTVIYDEGQGWCELHQESVCFIDKCSDRISKG